jgi:hypothetical protein
VDAAQLQRAQGDGYECRLKQMLVNIAAGKEVFSRILEFFLHIESS